MLNKLICLIFGHDWKLMTRVYKHIGYGGVNNTLRISEIHEHYKCISCGKKEIEVK